MKPTIQIEKEVYEKVMHWVRKSHFEVSGLGTVKVEKDGILRVVSVMLLPQKNGATHTDIQAEEVNKALFELRNSEGDLRWWWHSHVNMNVFWSGTDMDTIRKIGAGGWFAATVFNKKSESRSAYYGANGQTLQTPWGAEVAPLFLDELKTEITQTSDPRVAAWDEEYEKNVTNVRFYSGYGQGHMPWEKNEHGVWVRQQGGSAKAGEFQTTTGTTGGNGTGTVLDMTKEPPPFRPDGMGKKIYKTWKKQWRLKQETDVGHAIAQQASEGGPPDTVDEFGLDDYGFSQMERTLLAQQGWDSQDIDELLEMNVTPMEMLVMARHDVSPSEVILWYQQGHTISEIMDTVEGKELEDIPVADRKGVLQ